MDADVCIMIRLTEPAHPKHELEERPKERTAEKQAKRQKRRKGREVANGREDEVIKTGRYRDVPVFSHVKMGLDRILCHRQYTDYTDHIHSITALSLFLPT